MTAQRLSRIALGIAVVTVLGVTALIRSVAIAESARWQLESSALGRGSEPAAS